MLIYLLNIVLILFAGWLLLYLKPGKPHKKAFIVLAALSWILVSGLRGWGVGADTYAYYLAFERAAATPWEEAFDNCWQSYWHSSEAAEYMVDSEEIAKDPGYLVFNKICYMLCDGDYQIFLMLIAIIIFVPMGFFIYRNSEEPIFSYVLFSTLFYSFFAITGHRQSIATALVVFIGDKFIRERKFLPFLLISIVAFLIHKSVLVFFPFYFLVQWKVNGKYILTVLLALLGLCMIGQEGLQTIAGWFGYVRDLETGLPLNYILLMSAIGIAVLSHYKKIQSMAPGKNIELHATILAMTLTVLTIFNQGMMRVQQYYALYLMFSIPSLLKLFNPKIQIALYAIGEGLLILLLILNNPYYAFCWEPMVLPDAYR